MYKNNWIVSIVAVIAAALLVILWYVLGLNKIDAPLDLILGLCWVGFVVVFGFIFKTMEDRRRELLRVFYIGKAMTFNTSAGELSASGADEFTDKAEEVLKDIDYKSDPKKAPEGFKPVATVWTDRFDSEKGIWRGKVVDEASKSESSFDDADSLETVVQRYI